MSRNICVFVAAALIGTRAYAHDDQPHHQGGTHEHSNAETSYGRAAEAGGARSLNRAGFGGGSVS